MSASPNSGQFTYISSTGNGSTSINQSALRLQRSGNNGTAGACRNFDFSGNPETMSFAFDFAATGNPHANQNALIIQMGEEFNNNTTVEANNKVYAQFGISFPGNSGQFRISNITGNNHNTRNFNGTQRITWVLNRKNETITYTGPNNNSVILSANRADIWVGSTRVYNNVNVQTAGKKMLNFKIIFNPNQNCHVLLDNFGTLTANNTLPVGSYSLGSSSDFTSLTNNGGLFQFLNAQGSIAGNYFFKIESNLTNEIGTHRLNYLTGMDDYNIVISPNNASNYSITSASTTNTAGMIFLDGAKNVIFDGRAPGDLTENENTQRYLTFRNQNTNGPTFTLQNGASNNTIKFCNIEGRTNSVAHGVVFIGPSVAGKPASNGNLFYFNHIRNSNATPRHLFFINGTDVAINNQNKLEKNHIYNAFLLSNSSQALVINNYTKNISIEANHFYQSVNLAYGNSATYLHIIGAGRVGGSSIGVDSLIIRNNFIGGKAPNCGGDPWLLAVNSLMPMRIRAIDLRIPNDAYALVEGNTIDNIQMNFNRTTNTNEFSFKGIYVNSGRVDVLNNTIGSTNKMVFNSWSNNTTGLISVIGIEYFGTGKLVQNNTIKGFRGNASSGTFGFDMIGLYINHKGDSLTVSNNVIGNLNENESFRINYANVTTVLRGILKLTNEANKFVLLEQNTVAGLANYAHSTASSCAGIISGSASNINIQNNTIKNLTTNSTSDYTANGSAVIGVFLSSSAKRSEIFNNTISHLDAINWGNFKTLIQGIYAEGADTILIHNNKIFALNNNSAATASDAQPANVGIRLGNSSATGITVFNNMISLGYLLNEQNNEKPIPYIGIWDYSNTAASKTRIFYNSIVISGSTWGNNLNGFAMLKGRYDQTVSSGFFQAANNILVNRRTGNACNAAIGYPNASSNKNLINNNILFSATADRTVMNGMSTFLNINGWQAAGQDLYSSYENIAQPSALTACGTSSFTNLLEADLHLPNCEVRINSKGMIPQAPVSLAYDVDGELRRGSDVGADEVNNILTFVGSVSTDWHTANNWDLKFVPSCADSVVIRINGSVVNTPAGNVTVQRQPTVSTSQKAYFKSIFAMDNSTLTLANQSLVQGCWHDGILRQEGTIINNGSNLELAGNIFLRGLMNDVAGTLKFNIDEVDQFGSNPGLNDFIKLHNFPAREINIDGNGHLTTNHFEVLNQAIVKFNGNATRTFQQKSGGNGILSAGSEIHMLGHTFLLNGALEENDGVFVADQDARMILQGNSAMGGSLKFKNEGNTLKALIVNRSNGLVKIGTNLTVNDTLHLITGHLEIADEAIIMLPYENKLVGTINSTNCIYGSVKKFLNGNGVKYTYPVGRADRYRPASVIPQSNGLVGFTVSYHDKSAHNPYDLTSKSPEFEYVSDKEYWMINRDGDIAAKVELTWDEQSQINATHMGLARLQIMKWDTDDQMWISTGPNMGDASGSQSSGFILSDLISSFSPFTFGSYDIDALPVELLSFTAEPLGDDVLLKWTTASETNNDYFAVLRSTDASNFTEIGTVNGAGNSNNIINYQYVDPFAGKLNIPILYYRLKQIDFNGQSELHEIAPVKFNSDGSFQIIHASFMNGTNTIETSFTSPENGSGEVYCFDINGRLMGQTRINARKGTNKFEMPLNGNLTSGIYTIQIIMNNIAVAVKIPKADR